MLKCPICGKEKDILDLHFEKDHNLTIEERKYWWTKVKIDRSNRVYGITNNIFKV